MSATRALCCMIEGDERFTLDDDLAAAKPFKLLNFVLSFADRAGGVLVRQKESIICHARSEAEDQIGILFPKPALAHTRLGVMCDR